MHAKTLLQLKEQEVANLRETALQQLETELHAKQGELHALSSKFDQLKADFQYNLSLLENRDAELERYDQETAVLAAAVTDKEQQLAELQKLHAEATFELRAERAKAGESEFLAQAKRLELQQLLEDERMLHAEALLRTKEECEQTKRLLQRSLAEAQDELQQQRRELSAGFQVQAQQLEARYKQQADDALQEADAAMATARRREEEAEAARQREAEQIAATEAALAREREKDKALKALSWELDHMRRLKEQQVADVNGQLATLQQLSKKASEEAEAQLSSLSSQLAQAQHQLVEQASAAAAALARQQMQAREEAALLRVKMEQAQARSHELEVEVRELQGHLRTIRRETEGKVQGLEQELRLLRETSEMALGGYEQRKEQELAEVKEQLWAEQETCGALREKAETLSKALEERRADVTGLKDRLAASGTRERELQRKLVEAELKFEQQIESRQAAQEARDSEHVKQLTEQRDTAISALQDAQSRLLDKEAELGPLRDLLLQLSPRRGAAAVKALRRAGGRPTADAAAATAAGHTLAAPSSLSVESSQQQQQQQQPHHHQDSFRRLATQPLSVDVPGRAQDPLLDSLQDSLQISALPSPAFMQFDSPRATGSPVWLGAGAMSAAAAAAAAARAEQYLRNSKEGLDELLRPLPLHARVALATAPSTAPASPMQPSSPGGDAEHSGGAAAAALHAAEAQNQRLRGTLAIMRGEMEALQAAVATPAGGVELPQDVQVLQAELQESDKDNARALEHVEVLQRQLGLLQQQAAAAGGSPGAHAGLPDVGTAASLLELPYLRQRVQELAIENRQLRRQAMQLRLSSLSPQQQQQEEQQQQPGTGAPAAASVIGVAPLPEAAATAAAEADALMREVAEAQGQLQALRDENERLMELSNALRAERERLLALLSAWGIGHGESGVGADPMLPPPRQASPGRHHGAESSPPQPAPAGPAEPTGVPPTAAQAESTAGPAATPWPTRDRAVSPPLAQRNTVSLQGQQLQQRQQQHLVPDTGGSSAHRPSAVSPGDPSAVSPGDPHQVHFFADSTLHRSLSDSEIRSYTFAAAGAAVSRGDQANRSYFAPYRDHDRNPGWLTPVQEEAEAIAGSSSAAPSGIRPPSSVPGSATSRETASQRARLQALQRQATKPRVRNYNIRDSDQGD